VDGRAGGEQMVANAQASRTKSQLGSGQRTLVTSPQVDGIIRTTTALCPGGDWVFTIEGHPLPPGQMMDALDRGVDPGFLAAPAWRT
jgi:hypothetical protein